MTQGLRPLLARAAFVAAGAGLPALAMAHVGADAGSDHGLLDGFLHPFTGTDHLLAMVAVGIWSGLSARRVWAAPVAFAGMLLLGALLATSGVAFPAVEPMIWTSLLVIGLLLAAGTTLRTSLSAGLVGAFALFHGAAHGTELSGAAALVGMVAATAFLHIAGIGVGQWLAQRQPWLARLAGMGVALFGLGLWIA